MPMACILQWSAATCVAVPRHTEISGLLVPAIAAAANGLNPVEAAMGLPENASGLREYSFYCILLLMAALGLNRCCHFSSQGWTIMNASDQVRAYVRSHYIAPARKAGFPTVRVRAGEVHKALKWDLRRVPQVCAALSTRKFMRSANVELVKKSGPPSGQSTTVELTYKLLDEGKAQTSPRQAASQPERVKDGSGLEALYGILEEEFKALGGGEAFLKAERASWGPDPWERIAIEEKSRREGGR